MIACFDIICYTCCHLQVILDIVVKPDKPVVSYLTALTGLTQDIIDSKGVPLADAVQQLRSCLPKDAVLVGQNILQDVQWLGLREGTDFKSCLDLAGEARACRKVGWVAGKGRVGNVLLAAKWLAG
jgi:RNA exonuclease 4